MTCTYETVEAMAQAGWRQDQIEQLEREVELARRKAEAQSFADGDTLTRQQQRIAAAEKSARGIAHDRWHRELGDDMKQMNALAAFHDENPGEHFGTEVREKVMAVAGTAHELSKKKGG